MGGGGGGGGAVVCRLHLIHGHTTEVYYELYMDQVLWIHLKMHNMHNLIYRLVGGFIIFMKAKYPVIIFSSRNHPVFLIIHHQVFRLLRGVFTPFHTLRTLTSRIMFTP